MTPSLRPMSILFLTRDDSHWSESYIPGGGRRHFESQALITCGALGGMAIQATKLHWRY
jgi:hypothetical protein